LRSTVSFSYSLSAACPVATSHYLWFNHPYDKKSNKYDAIIPLRNRILEESQA